MYFSEVLNFKKSQNIILEIEKCIKSNFDEISRAIEEDNQFFAENVSFIKIIKSIDLIKNENWKFKEDTEKCVYTSLGNIAVIYNGQSDIAMYVILKSIKTNNNLVLFDYISDHKATRIIINIVNKVLKQNDEKLIINSKNYKTIEEIVEYKEFFNKYFCIGDIEKYKLLKTKVNMNIIYNSYGTLSMYLDDKSDVKTLREIDDYIFKNNIKLDLFNDDIKDVIDSINKSENDFMLLIYSSDKEKIKTLIEKTNVKNISINKNPFLNDYNILICDEELFYKKKVLF